MGLGDGRGVGIEWIWVGIEIVLELGCGVGKIGGVQLQINSSIPSMNHCHILISSLSPHFSCKANIGGRRCNQCVPGYSYFPRCVPCSCDRKGTTDDVCDQDSARCLCKDNVQGVQCSQCAPETFYLEDRNPKGCTKCFCFGHTTNCQSSNLRREQVSVKY